MLRPQRKARKDAKHSINLFELCGDSPLPSDMSQKDYFKQDEQKLQIKPYPVILFILSRFALSSKYPVTTYFLNAQPIIFPRNLFPSILHLSVSFYDHRMQRLQGHRLNRNQREGVSGL